MGQDEKVPLEKLHVERYGRVLCYPRYDPKELKSRIRELEKLGVIALEFSGRKTVSNVPVLGKGCVGIVVIAYTSVGKVALKIRRVDADRAGMMREAEMLKRANAVGVGPKLLGVTKNFLVMEFIEGELLPSWVRSLRGRGARSRLRWVLRAVLEQCWMLDKAGLDHGELSRAPKHVVIGVNNNPCIVDFETASTTRRVSNVTSLCQFLFLGSEIATVIRRRLGGVNREELIAALRAYKQRRMRKNFQRILRVCGLD